MITAARTAPCPTPLRVLLIGEKDEDFFLVREILERNRSLISAELDHVRNLAEAKIRMQENEYGLVLFDHATSDGAAIRLVSNFLQDGKSVPFVVLSEDADERTVAETIGAGAWNFVSKSQLDGATLVGTIHSTLALHSLRQGQQVAEEMLRKLSLAVEASADTVMVTDRQGVIEYVNPAFETLTGYLLKEVVGHTPRILKSNRQSREFYQAMWRTVCAGNVYRGILLNRKKSGELYYVEENISPVRDAAGQITHFICNGRDLTERFRLEEQLLQAQKMDAIGRLAGGVAHDFNNLLTIITSYSELALDDVPPGSPVNSKIQEVLLAARRAAELTRQLLAFSRKQPQALRIVDLNQVISKIAGTLPRLIREDIHFEFQPGPGIGQVQVDPVQIEQILMNLAANARDAMPQGGHLRMETCDVRVSDDYVHSKPAVIPKGHYALITVSDDGTGISSEDLPHIFEPFFTTKPDGRGTGLGLATVYGIVKQNRGFVWVYSEKGCGTVFKIYLPCVPRQDRQSDRDNPEDERPLPGSETLLLVEDEHAIRRATAEFLQLQGYRVLEAKDGMEALAVAKEQGSHIDLIVTDVVMPNLSGGELARQLSQFRTNIRFLFVSGYAGQTLLDHNVFDLDTNFLQKPFTLKQLSHKVRAVLERPSSVTTQA